MSEEILKKLKEHDGQLDLIALTVVGHTERLKYIRENMVTKKEHLEMMETLDKIVKLAQKKD